MSRTPVCLVTGFLGSGKTTFLRRLIERYSDRRLVYLVNEFSSTDVDGQRLALPKDRTISVVGGSIFCRCLVTEFVEMLRAARTYFAGEVEGVVVEASGIADPRIFKQMLTETELDRVYAPAMHITLVDPGTFRKLRSTLPSTQAQVEAADVVLINKTDLYPTRQLTETEAEIRGLNPTAWLIRTEHADAEVDIFTESKRIASAGDYALCRDPNFCTSAAHPPAPVTWEKLRDAVTLLSEGLYRAKGFLLCSDGWRYVDWAAGEWTEESVESGGTSELVLIARSEAGEQVRRLRQRIEAGTYCR